MKKSVTLFLLIIFISCEQNVSTPRLQLESTIINDSIYTIMAGDLLVFDEYLVWSNPFSKEYFLHVHDKNTGEEIGKMGKIGLGPDEFVTPLMSSIIKNREIKVSDANIKKAAFLSVDSLLQNKPYYKEIREDEEDLMAYTHLEDNLFLRNTDDGHPDYFFLKTKNNLSSFGVYPIENLQFHFGGNLRYEPDDGFLVFATWDFPYISLYKKEDNTFKLLWEKKEKVGYHTIKDDEVILDKRRDGPKEITFTADYIVTLERDIEFDKTDENTVGRDISKRPYTVFVYDYDSNLKYIANIGYPIGRIAGNRESNILYAIVASPEYSIAKCELP